METITSAFKSQVPSFDCKNIGFTKMAFSGVESGSGVGTFVADEGSLLNGLLSGVKNYHSKIIGDRLVTTIFQGGKEMIHQAWKEGSQICESLALTAETTESVQHCYLGKFNALLLQATCGSDVKINYYPIIGGVIGALGLYESIRAFQYKSNYLAYSWMAVMVVGLAILANTANFTASTDLLYYLN